MSHISIDQQLQNLQEDTNKLCILCKGSTVTPLHVKGMTNMSLKQLQNFISDCVSNYATYNKLDDFYSLNISNLPDFVQDEFAALIMAENESLASEATGPDNKNWEKKMLPALLRYLKNSTDKDESIEFTNTWRTCVTSYFLDRMQELIDSELGNFNHENFYCKSEEKMYGIPRTL
jgi:hypothetical protein